MCLSSADQFTAYFYWCVLRVMFCERREGTSHIKFLVKLESALNLILNLSVFRGNVLHTVFPQLIGVTVV